MKRYTKTRFFAAALAGGLLALGCAGTAEATLISRLYGKAYYDDVLDITWLADSHLAARFPFDLPQSQFEIPGSGEIGSTGRMDWNTANAWIAKLNGADAFGFSDWRLPTLSPGPLASTTSLTPSFSNNGTTDVGFAKTTTDGSDGGWRDSSGTPVSEMGYMYYVNLANLGLCAPDDADPKSCVVQSGWGLVNTAPFLPPYYIEPAFYWSGLPVAESPDTAAWSFGFSGGEQRPVPKDETFFAWAVRDGDIAAASSSVPAPPTALLMGTGLTLLGWGSRRKRRP